VAVHEKARRFHVQLRAHVFADLDQVLPALAALAGFRFVAVLDARQFRRQRLASGTLAPALGGLVVRLVELFLDGGQVGVDLVLEQQALLAALDFAGLAEADAAMVGQYQGQRLILKSLAARTWRTFSIKAGSVCWRASSSSNSIARRLTEIGAC
jgi:hypothetical protein